MRTRDPAGSRLEAFLARLYSDDALYRRFLDDAPDAARREGLTSAEAISVAAIDRDGLELARKSYARKRAGKERHTRGSVVSRVLAWVTSR